MKGRPTLLRLPPATAAARHPRRPAPQAPRPARPPPRPLHPLQIRPHPQALPRLRQPRLLRQAVRCIVILLGTQLICVMLCDMHFYMMLPPFTVCTWLCRPTRRRLHRPTPPRLTTAAVRTRHPTVVSPAPKRCADLTTAACHVSSQHACSSHVQRYSWVDVCVCHVSERAPVLYVEIQGQLQ